MMHGRPWHSSESVEAKMRVTLQQGKGRKDGKRGRKGKGRVRQRLTMGIRGKSNKSEEEEESKRQKTERWKNENGER